MKTLLVSNSHEMLVNTKASLENKGHEVVAVEDGVSAWIQLFDADIPFQVVISDWLLPAPLDGLALCKKIRSASFSKKTYVIMSTNRASTADLQDGINAGADDFIAPTSMHIDELESKLRTAERVLALEKTILDKVTVIDALNAKIEQQSTKDKLTGLYNRRAFHVNLEDKIRLARRMEQPISLLMLDIDKFKAIKEKHGSGSGDGIVKMITSVLKEHCRTSDFVARFGAEKFGIILPCTDEDGSLICADGLRKAANALFWESEQVTISIGASTIDENTYASGAVCDLHTDMMSNAEQALYQSESAGFNRISHYVAPLQKLEATA